MCANVCSDLTYLVQEVFKVSDVILFVYIFVINVKYPLAAVK